MSKLATTGQGGGGWVSTWLNTVLAVSAFLLVGFRLLLAFGPEDSETLESPLMLSVARQLVAGPRELYGPFGGKNPLVLIHAPLYYHLAALVAWPLTRGGLDPVSAARIAGRLVSLLGLVATLAAVYRLARLDGAPRRAGWWAVLLIAATPAIGGLPFAVRPDMLGVALQTTGVLLVLAALHSERPGGAGLGRAYAAFGLAVCVKQTFLVAPAVSTGFLLRAWWRGRLMRKEVERSLLIAVAIVGSVYGLEEVATGGQMGQAVFLAAGSIGRIHPGGWLHAGTVLTAVIGKSAGLIALLAAAGLVWVAARRRLHRMAFAAGVLIVGAIAALLVLQLVLVRQWVTGPLVALLLVAVALVIPGCAWLARRSIEEGSHDAALWTYCAGELALMSILCLASDGAWINYAIQAVVFAGVLTARALWRACDQATGGLARLPAALAALAVLASALMEIKEVNSRRRTERAELERIFAHARRPSSAFFFAGRPGLNRLYGRLDLVYDEWLYPVFESLRLAEPRSRWLRLALSSGPVRVVVRDSDSARIAGIPDPLPALGYTAVVRVGEFLVWTR